VSPVATAAASNSVSACSASSIEVSIGVIAAVLLDSSSAAVVDGLATPVAVNTNASVAASFVPASSCSSCSSCSGSSSPSCSSRRATLDGVLRRMICRCSCSSPRPAKFARGRSVDTSVWLLDTDRKSEVGEQLDWTSASLHATDVQFGRTSKRRMGWRAAGESAIPPMRQRERAAQPRTLQRAQRHAAGEDWRWGGNEVERVMAAAKGGTPTERRAADGCRAKVRSHSVLPILQHERLHLLRPLPLLPAAAAARRRRLRGHWRLVQSKKFPPHARACAMCLHSHPSNRP